MGLFSKKPKPSTEDPAAAPLLPPPPVPEVKSAPAPNRAPNKKGKRVSIDPVDFLSLRGELMDLKARLMAAEQSRAIVESRLAALDATALALSNEQSGTADAAARLAELEARVGELGAQSKDDQPDDGAATDAQAALQARIDELAAKVEQNAQQAPGEPAGVDPDLMAKIDALESQVVQATAAAEAARADAARLEAGRQDSLVPGVDPATAARLDQLEARVTAVVAKADTPVFAPLIAAPAATETDPDVLARLDQLTERVAMIDVLTGQLSQLNARVSAQAEFGAQLSSLRDRINEVQGGSDLDERVNALADRLTVTDALAAQLGQLAERVTANDTAARMTSEQVAALEQRVSSVGTELANQISELGRDIDGLAERTAEVANGTVSDEVMAALRSGQIKLANEQARYEIAFREDLAALAEHLRRRPVPPNLSSGEQH